MRAHPKLKAAATGVACGVAYGQLLQTTARHHLFDSFALVMSLGFVFILPAVLGVITVWFAGLERRLLFAIFAPWLTAASCLGSAIVIGWEGTICLVLQDTYWIEANAAGVKLHLQSRFRLSTRFNFYAGWWSGVFMRGAQNSILAVLEHRCAH